MRVSAIGTTLMFLIFANSFTLLPADAQNKKGHAKAGKKESGPGGREEDIDGPIDMSKFPGVGSIDSWKTSVPEFRVGMEKMRAHRWDEAIEHFRASIALYEYQPRAWLEIGKATEAKGGLVEDAEKSYRQCLKLDNQSWAGWKNLGNVLYMQKRYPEAREAVSSALQLRPPAKATQQLEKMVQMLDAASRNADTGERNTAH